MKEYEIIYNDFNKGKVRIYIDNLYKDNLKNSLIISNSNIKYDLIDKNREIQLYEVNYIINDIDELYDIIKKYIFKSDDIFKEIEKIKEYNNIKNIKKNTNIKIIIPEIYLNNLSISKENIDLESLFKSKIYFIKKVCEHNNLSDIFDLLNNIVNNYNDYKSNNEYDFLTEEEIVLNIKKYINKLDNLIKDIEKNNNYKYGRDYIYPIVISN